MPTPWFPKPYADFVQRLRVPGGFLLAIAFAWLSSPSPASLAAGLPLALAGLALRAWAAGHLAKNQQLATAGPYAHVRNPLYIGTLLVAAGLAAASRSAAVASLAGVVFLLVYLPVIQLEEEHLRKLFPNYPGYAARVPALLPRLRPVGDPSCFRWRLYLRNREYQALAAFLAAVALLLCKS